MTLLIRLILISAVFTLSACSTSLLKPENSDQPAENNTETNQAEQNKEAIKLQDFDLEKDTLYDLIVAEVAAQRNQFNITLVNYILQARITRDPEIIKRAINAAQLLKDLEAIQEMALLWAEVEPDSIPAHQLLAFQYALQQNYADSLHHTEILIGLGGDARVDSLAIGSQSLPEEDKLSLLALYQELYTRHADNNEVAYSIALVQRNLKQYDAALKTLQPVIERSPEFEPAAVLRTNLIYDQGRLKEAIDYAEDKFDDFPGNHNLGRLYASMLIEDKQLEKAEEVFFSLMTLYPQAPSLKLSHALVMLENGKTEETKAELQELLDAGFHINEANFYLGRIADHSNDYLNAINYYQQVKPGMHFEAALERASFLLAKEEGKLDKAIDYLHAVRKVQPDFSLTLWLLEFKLLTTLNEEERALATLNTAIKEFPNDQQLLYARAMTLEAKGDLAGMETDLRTIINNDPKHAVAINALGYTLANRTDRLEEAYELIKTALTLKPDNPAILDSMGWVLFKLDQKEEALLLLLKAYQTYPDAEVAAHLGEVFWALGKQDEAQSVWQQALQNSPGHKALIDTIKRFVPFTVHPTQSEPDTNNAPETIDSDAANETPTELKPNIDHP